MSIDLTKNNVFIEGRDVLPEWENENKALNKISTILKSYLELDNVSFLFGAGSSVNIGSISIANIPFMIEKKIKDRTVDVDGTATPDVLYKEFIALIKELQKLKSTDTELRTGDGDLKYPLELFLNYLVAQEYIAEINPQANKIKLLKELIKVIKEGLFELCDLESLPLPTWLNEDVSVNLKKNKFYYHEKFIKKILQRPLNLRRVNIFTTNYDLAFEYSFDKLGVNYINGFSGFQKRTFKPETFDYDIFYPGSTTQGRVQKIEKVLKYYKIHGSLSWIKEEPSSNNVYGILEVPIEQLRKSRDFENLMIYPTTSKKSFTLDFPYSELFRHFSSSITRSQSTLITYGYSFNDEHINDLIYQALSIPSFTLIIIDYNGTKMNKEILRLKELNDPRIIIIQGNELGSFPTFVESLLPDLIEANTYERIAETLKQVFDKSSTSSYKTTYSAPTP